MPDDLRLVAQLLAFQRRRAVPFTNTRHVDVRRDALVFSPVAMAAEDATVHIVAYGTAGGAPKILSVPDPRVRHGEHGQFRLFAEVGRDIDAYFESCRSRGSFPQIWVSSRAGVSLIDTLAERLRYTSPDTAADYATPEDIAVIRRLGELLTYPADRFPLEGQQAMMPATRALSEHFVTGQQEAENEHLATVLVWIDPPAERSLDEAIAEAELNPMGVKTDPAFDQDVLAPLVDAYNDARRGSAPKRVLNGLRRQIQAALEPVALRIYDGTQQAVSILQSMDRPDLPSLADLRTRETDAFEDFMASRDSGFFLTIRDRPKPAAFKYAEREDAVNNVEAALACEDGVGRARAMLRGDHLVGRVVRSDRTRLRPRVFEYRLTLISDQPVLRLRQRDVVHLVSDPRLTCRVESIRRDNEGTHVELILEKGMRSPGPPSVGTVVRFTTRVPVWDSLIRIRVQMARRLDSVPWSHDPNGLGVPSDGPPPPPDPLALVEGLR